MATLGSFDYPDQLLQDCNLTVAEARAAADTITAIADGLADQALMMRLQSAANVLRYLAADTTEAMAAEYVDEMDGRDDEGECS